MSLAIGTPIPSLDGATEWLNATPFPDDPHGNLILIHFWAKSCPACKANMPGIQQLREQYAPYGLCMIAVHTPRGEFDLDIDKVTGAAGELGITEPCAIDNQHTIGDRFGVDAWPTYFLFGADRRLKRHAKGNFGVRMMRAALERMLEGEAVAI